MLLVIKLVHNKLFFFTENQVDGESFLELAESDVKELVKPLGVVKKIVKLLREVNLKLCIPTCMQYSTGTMMLCSVIPKLANHDSLLGYVHP